jgi:hypothetical protein
MQICLTGVPSKDRAGVTHAYFPALMNCCATLEYLASLFAGHTRPCNVREIIAYAKFLPKPDYSGDAIRVLFCAFRHSVAHRGIASGVWVDRHQAKKERRITWNVHADARRPALEMLSMPGVLRLDPPWDCPYTHRAQIHLGRLWRDIVDSVLAPDGYRDELVSNRDLKDKFTNCMRRLYPK